MLASDTGLSTTITSSGLLDEARTRPQVPSSRTTRTPLTVTSSRIFWPATAAPPAAAASYCPVISLTMAYLASSLQWGDIVGEPHVLGSASLSSASVLLGLRSSISHTAMRSEERRVG